MKAGIILIGTELLNGGMIDTNSIYISEQLNKYGIEISFKITVHDEIDDITGAIDYAKKNSDLVIMSGGLGPTIDDLTKNAIAKYLDLTMVVEPEELEEIRSKFQNINVPFVKSNIRQIEKPKGAISFKNDVGMAPAIYIDGISAFPGVPRELYNMLPKFLEWYDKEKHLVKDKIYIKDLLTYGIGESLLDEKVKDLFTEEGIRYEFLVKSYATLVRLQGFEHNKNKVEKIVEKIYNEIGENIFGEDGDTMESKIVDFLKGKGLKLSTAESCTGGSIASKIVNVSGASNVYQEGFVTYSNEAKMKYLGVKKETLDKYGAVSEETAREMVTGLNTDVGIATTGIAGPKSDDTNKPVGLVYIGTRIKNDIKVKEYRFNSKWDRNRIRERATLQAMFDLIKMLKDLK